MSFGSSDSDHKKCRSTTIRNSKNRNFFLSKKKLLEPKRRREKRGEKWKS
jgi:hypothetical protein